MQGVVEVVKLYLERNASVDEVIPVVEPLCLVYMNQTNGYNGTFMCPGILKSYLPIVSQPDADREIVQTSKQ